jgi:hypothetical protein
LVAFAFVASAACVDFVDSVVWIAGIGIDYFREVSGRRKVPEIVGLPASLHYYFYLQNGIGVPSRSNTAVTRSGIVLIALLIYNIILSHFSSIAYRKSADLRIES